MRFGKDAVIVAHKKELRWRVKCDKCGRQETIDITTWDDELREDLLSGLSRRGWLLAKQHTRNPVAICKACRGV